MGGIWCNSDETNYFSAYTQAVLTAHETDSASNYGTYRYILSLKALTPLVHATPCLEIILITPMFLKECNAQ